MDDAVRGRHFGMPRVVVEGQAALDGELEVLGRDVDAVDVQLGMRAEVRLGPCLGLRLDLLRFLADRMRLLAFVDEDHVGIGLQIGQLLVR